MAAPKINLPRKAFHVYDARMEEAGGTRVTTNAESGERTVLLTDAEARYFIDQGAIGEKPLAKMNKTARAAVDQIVQTEPEQSDEQRAAAAERRPRK